VFGEGVKVADIKTYSGTTVKLHGANANILPHPGAKRLDRTLIAGRHNPVAQNFIFGAL
jgi:hypothetical protein